MNGIIIIDKPIDKTSHNMVSFMRRMTGIKKIGHTGTLDPMATGVLPVCIGTATKAADMLTLSEKTYIAEFVLGKTTDTLDARGNITGEYSVNVTRKDIEKAIMSFLGDIEQIPPMYSAIKMQGKKLYELARAGVEVERKARKVTIENIDINDINMEENKISVTVKCSKGTYIRTLCDDIGKKLGTGAYMTSLRRTATGMFGIENAKSVQQIEELAKQGKLETCLIPTDNLFFGFPEIRLNEKQTRSIKNGIRMSFNGIEGQSYRLYDENGEFLCISKITDGRLVLEKSFWNR